MNLQNIFFYVKDSSNILKDVFYAVRASNSTTTKTTAMALAKKLAKEINNTEAIAVWLKSC
jgi:O-acetylhomoserine/O-acetylserine sulfhydrylase-like pyridoxal-dependent enzyme